MTGRLPDVGKLMRHFLIITNTYKDENGRLTGELAAYIRKKGGECDCFYSDGERKSEAAPALDKMDPATDCVMVLGGDGTLIRAASRLVDSRIPLIGVNLGTVGYLCELEESNVFDAVDRLMADDCMVEERMMLTGAGILGGVREEYGVALNDIVIHRTGELSVVSLIVYVNGEYLHTFRADGIIVSTPTGSTGYNMSAGGPIVDPKAQMILITPINAHNLNSRSIVIGAEDEVVVEIGRRRSQKDETLEVSFDGDTAARLVVGDKFSIRKASDTTRILKLSNKSFLEILSNGRQKYVALQETDENLSQKYVRVFHDGFVSMDMAQNILVIKTVSGMAMAVAAALDAMHMHEIVGCIAGDDTIMCAIRSVDDTVAVMNRLKKLVED